MGEKVRGGKKRHESRRAEDRLEEMGREGSGRKRRRDEHGGKQQREGTYLFTIDWCAGDYNELDFGYAEKPDQHKCGHVIELDDGNYAIQPNNRLRIFDPSMAADPSKPLIHRLVNTKIWSVEDTSKWITDEDQEGSYDYEYKEMKDGEEKKHSK